MRLSDIRNKDRLAPLSPMTLRRDARSVWKKERVGVLQGWLVRQAT